MRVEWYLGLPAKDDFVTCLHVTKHVIIMCLSRATHMTPYFSPILAVFSPILAVFSPIIAYFSPILAASCGLHITTSDNHMHALSRACM